MSDAPGPSNWLSAKVAAKRKGDQKSPIEPKKPKKNSWKRPAGPRGEHPDYIELDLARRNELLDENLGHFYETQGHIFDAYKKFNMANNTCHYVRKIF